MSAAKRRGGTPGSAPPFREVTSAQVEAHRGLVHMKLGQMQRAGQLAIDIDYDEYYAAGLEGVWQALRRWRPERGRQSTYLSSYIWGYVMHYQRRATKARGWSVAAGRRIATIVSYDQALDDGDGSTMLELLPALDDTAEAGAAAATVAVLREVAQRLQGLRGDVARNLVDGEPEPWGDLAHRHGVSRQRVQQILAETRELLRPHAMDPTSEVAA